MEKSRDHVRTQSELHALPTDEIGLAWLAEIIAVNARQAAPSYWHRHRRQLEMIYCLHGEMCYDFRDRPSITLPGGSAIIIPPGVEHRITKGMDTPCRRLSILVNPTLPRQRDFIVFSRREFGDIYRAMIAKAFRPIAFSRTTAARLRLLWEAAMNANPVLSPLLASKLRLLVCTLLHNCADNNPITGTREGGHLIDEAISWLEDHCGETIRIPQLVAFMGYGRARFFELFKERTGLSPADYLNRLRIRKAEKLIRTGSRRSIVDIAREVGFRDASHFAATFRRMTGKSPSACRSKIEDQDPA